MIAAAGAVQPVSLPVNWFDGFFAIVLAAGIFQGRRNGMAKELLPLAQWLCVILICGFTYAVFGEFFVNSLGWGKATSYVTAYIVLMLLIVTLFVSLRRKYTERLVNANYFHNSEYYLGMVSGFIRCFCVLIVLMALVNAPVYSEKEIAAHAAYVKKTYGGGLYGGDYFPDMQEIQEQVFTKSFVGPYAKKFLSVFFIQTTAAAPAKPKK